MTAEGWRHMDADVGEESDYDSYFWTHPPSSRVVAIDQCRRSQWRGPVWGPEPTEEQTPGYCVTLRVHDEWGNPIEGDGFWIESFGLAVKLGREIRRHVLGERAMPTERTQLTLDDAIGPERAP